MFLPVLHRMLVSGSDRVADRWREDYAIAGVEHDWTQQSLDILIEGVFSFSDRDIR